jgi:hypothetical protein
MQAKVLVEMDLGARYTKQDNPSFLLETDPICLWPKDKHEPNGKVGTRLNVNANYDTQSTLFSKLN